MVFETVKVSDGTGTGSSRVNRCGHCAFGADYYTNPTQSFKGVVVWW